MERANCRKDEPNRSSGDASYGSALRDDARGRNFYYMASYHARAVQPQHLSHACSLILRRASSSRMDFVAQFSGFASIWI